MLTKKAGKFVPVYHYLPLQTRRTVFVASEFTGLSSKNHVYSQEKIVALRSRGHCWEKRIFAKQ